MDICPYVLVQILVPEIIGVLCKAFNFTDVLCLHEEYIN